MAKKITPEIIEQINELYLQIGVKSRVAKELGISPSTVSKYLIKDYCSKANQVLVSCSEEIIGPAVTIEKIRQGVSLFNFTLLTEEEWNEIEKMQTEEILI